ncbi:MAG: tetrahydromethanopterin S-methyltransferase subunit A [Candidatus Thorarchaeota archaeon]
MVSVSIDTTKCKGCGVCIESCPANVLSLCDSDVGEVAIIVDETNCSACGACAVKCPEQAVSVSGYEMLKVEPPPKYPPEEGRYLRGNDFSPVAVVAILDTPDTNIQPELTKLVTTAIEAGAALAGTLQTENIGIEKLIVNVVANPNIRFLILCWREAEGHRPAEALFCLVENGVADDKRRTIIGATAPTPYLANISVQAIERFRQQISIVNLIQEDDPPFGMRPENVKNAVRACIQEKPTKFGNYILYDPGAWPEPPICEKLSKRLNEPWRPDLSPEEMQTLQKMKKAALTQISNSDTCDSTRESKRKDDELLLEFLGLKEKKEKKTENSENEN